MATAVAPAPPQPPTPKRRELGELYFLDCLGLLASAHVRLAGRGSVVGLGVWCVYYFLIFSESPQGVAAATNQEVALLRLPGRRLVETTGPRCCCCLGFFALLLKTCCTKQF
jgi:hypothetical protein